MAINIGLEGWNRSSVLSDSVVSRQLLQQRVDQDFRRKSYDEKVVRVIEAAVDDVPKLLHAISLVRLARSINWLASIALVIYGYLLRLLTYPGDQISRTEASYNFSSFLIDYGLASLVLGEIGLVTKTYFAMLKFNRVKHRINEHVKRQTQ